MEKDKLVQLAVRWLIILTTFLGLPMFLAWMFTGPWIAVVLNKIYWIFGFAAGLTGLRWGYELSHSMQPARVTVRTRMQDTHKFVLRELPRINCKRNNLSKTVKLILEPVGDYVKQQISQAYRERPVFNQTVRLVLTEL
jgi:hypothetical protein